MLTNCAEVLSAGGKTWKREVFITSTTTTISSTTFIGATVPNSGLNWENPPQSLTQHLLHIESADFVIRCWDTSQVMLFIVNASFDQFLPRYGRAGEALL